jgi:potassium uptake TrkH family protein
MNTLHRRKRKSAVILKRLGRIPFILGLFSILCIIYDFGFAHHVTEENILRKIYDITLVVGSISILARFFISGYRPRLKSVPFDLALLLLLVLVLSNSEIGGSFIRVSLFSQPFWIYIATILVFLREFSGLRIEFKRAALNPAQIFVLSYLSLIVTGTFLFKLPEATVDGISLTDAFFTSVSAVCITGLAVVDTGSSFTILGQVIILLLFQAGGLGIMTFTSYFAYFFRGGSSYDSQLAMRDYTRSDRLSEVFTVLRRIIVITLIIETAGAILIFQTISPDLMPSLTDRLFFSGFHSVSAFCNAGFSLISESFYESPYRFNYPLHLVVAFLIIAGGMGFPIVFNLFRAAKTELRSLVRKFFYRYERIRSPWLVNVNTRLVLITTLILLVTGTVTILVLEYNNTLQEHRFHGKIIAAFFGAATARTGGFNTVDTAALSIPAALIIMFLMWVGASPSSTGGGIKTSTFTVALLSAIGIARGKTRLEVFRREIPDNSVNRAYTIIFLSVIVIGLTVMLLSIFNPEVNYLDICFESISAFSTVGLSRGITPNLTTASKLVLTLTMFIGRVGMLTILMALFNKGVSGNYRYPAESILIN